MLAGAVNSFGLKPCVLLHDHAGVPGFPKRYSRLLAFPSGFKEFVQSCIDLLDGHRKVHVSRQRNGMRRLAFGAIRDLLERPDVAPQTSRECCISDRLRIVPSKFVTRNEFHELGAIGVGQELPLRPAKWVPALARLEPGVFSELHDGMAVAACLRLLAGERFFLFSPRSLLN